MKFKFTKRRVIAALSIAAIGAILFGTSASGATTPPWKYYSNKTPVVWWGCVYSDSKDSTDFGAIAYHGKYTGTQTCGPNHQLVTGGLKGDKGDKGNTGVQGIQGVKGDKGDPGTPGADAPTPEWGVAQVFISRSGGAATDWADFSTILGSPSNFGSNASGVVRASCSGAQAPCVLSLKAYSTTDSNVYARVDIDKQDYDTGAALGNCEYGDGSDNNGATTAVTATPTVVKLGIGGSLDCGSSQTTSDGTVTELQVPKGRYDVHVTVYFRTNE